MTLINFPMRIMFLFFLVTFLLIGLFPVIQKFTFKLRQALETRADKKSSSGKSATQSTLALESAQRQGAQQLNDFDVFILWQLAQSGRKGLTDRQIENQLHLDSTTSKKSLRLLRRKGLIHSPKRFLRKKRYKLSTTGYEFALAKGFTPRIHQPDEQFKIDEKM